MPFDCLVGERILEPHLFLKQEYQARSYTIRDFKILLHEQCLGQSAGSFDGLPGSLLVLASISGRW